MLQLRPPGSNCHALGHQGSAFIIQFNESFDYPPSLVITNLQLTATVAEINAFELKLFRTLNFRLKYTTPFCFIGVLKRYLEVPVISTLYQDLEMII